MRVDPIGFNGGINLFLYAFNNPNIISDPAGFLGEGTTGEGYGVYENADGSHYIRVEKCNVIIFFGHGIRNLDVADPGIQDDKVKLDQSNIPVTVYNDSCSAATSYGCNAEHYTTVETPIPDVELPNNEVDVGEGAEDLWGKAIKQANTICQTGCCKDEGVTVRFECMGGGGKWMQKTFLSPYCGEEEHISCK